jgi:hypothetical protein
MSEPTLAEREMAKRLSEMIAEIEREQAKLPSVGKCACNGVDLCAWHTCVNNDLFEAIKFIRFAQNRLTSTSG